MSKTVSEISIKIADLMYEKFHIAFEIKQGKVVKVFVE